MKPFAVETTLRHLFKKPLIVRVGLFLFATSILATVWRAVYWEAHARREQEHALVSERGLAECNAEIAVFKEQQAAREQAFAEREKSLAEREAAIAGREDAATERTQSSFQGLLIQQQLTKNLEALKASLPDMTPEVEKLAKEHAQFGAERQRLEKEIADLRRGLGQPDSSVVR